MEMKAKKIEEKCSILKEELKKHNQYLIMVNDNINKLKKEKKTIESNISKLDGAIQAYSEAIRLSLEEITESQNSHISEMKCSQLRTNTANNDISAIYVREDEVA